MGKSTYNNQTIAVAYKITHKTKQNKSKHFTQKVTQFIFISDNTQHSTTNKDYLISTLTCYITYFNNSMN